MQFLADFNPNSHFHVAWIFIVPGYAVLQGLFVLFDFHCFFSFCLNSLIVKDYKFMVEINI